jgi:hypothetical protein
MNATNIQGEKETKTSVSKKTGDWSCGESSPQSTDKHIMQGVIPERLIKGEPKRAEASTSYNRRQTARQDGSRDAHRIRLLFLNLADHVAQMRSHRSVSRPRWSRDAPWCRGIPEPRNACPRWELVLTEWLAGTGMIYGKTNETIVGTAACRYESRYAWLAVCVVRGQRRRWHW